MMHRIEPIDAQCDPLMRSNGFDEGGVTNGVYVSHFFPLNPLMNSHFSTPRFLGHLSHPLNPGTHCSIVHTFATKTH